jgi:hypothetical protein
MAASSRHDPGRDARGEVHLLAARPAGRGGRGDRDRQAGTPVVRLVAVRRTSDLASVRGALAGKVWIADDFDRLPDEIVQAFEAG